MPTIERYTAKQGPGVIQNAGVNPNSFGGQAFEALGQFGNVLQQTARHLQAQQDDVDLTNLASQFDVLIPQAKQAALSHPEVQAVEDPIERQQVLAQKFEEILTQGREDIEKSTQSEAVKTALLSHQQRLFPSSLVQLHQESMTQQADENNAKLTQHGIDLAHNLPRIPDTGERAIKLNNYRMLLERSEQRGLMSKLDVTNKWHNFSQNYLESQMDYLRQTNPSQLQRMDRDGAFMELDPLRRLKILAQANQDQDHAETMQEKANKKMMDAHELDWSAQANQGKLSAFQLTEALAGRNQFITPDKARQYATINENPPDVGGTSPVQVLMQAYHGQEMSLATIRATRKKLNQAALDLGRPSRQFDKALNELQADELSMRTVTAAEKAASVQYAKDRYAMESDPKLPGMIGTFQKNQEEKEKAEIQMRIKKGEKPDAVLDDIRKRHEKKKTDIPDRTKGVLDLLK